VYQRCCGMDVHKNSITACLMLIDDDCRNSFSRISLRMASRQRSARRGSWNMKSAIYTLSLFAGIKIRVSATACRHEPSAPFDSDD
jgi:hypothetical protein